MLRTLVASTALLTGCSYNTPWPIEPHYNRSEQVSKGTDQASLTLAQSRLLIAGYKSTLQSAASERRQAEIVASEILYYGTLLTVIGSAVVASQGVASLSGSALHARNLGAAAGLGSSLYGSRYKLAEQQIALRKAASRLECASDAIAPISEHILDALLATPNALDDLDAKITNPSFRSRLIEIPRQTTHFIERQVIPELRASLQAVILAQPSREELLSKLEEWSRERSSGIASARSISPASINLVRTRATAPGLEIDAFVSGATAYSDALSVCAAQ